MSINNQKRWMTMALDCVKNGQLPIQADLNDLAIVNGNNEMVPLGTLQHEDLSAVMASKRDLIHVPTNQNLGPIQSITMTEPGPTIGTNGYLFSSYDLSTEYYLAKGFVYSLAQSIREECERDDKFPRRLYHDELLAIVSKDRVGEERWEELCNGEYWRKDDEYITVSIYEINGKDELLSAALATEDMEYLGQVTDVHTGLDGIIDKISTQTANGGFVISDIDHTLDIKDLVVDVLEVSVDSQEQEQSHGRG